MSVEHYPKPEAGMEVFVKPTNRRSSFTSTITKVGRLYATLSGDRYRMRLSDWRIDGEGRSSPGTCYPSEAYYNEKIALITAWNKFSRTIMYTTVPDGATVETIEQAAKLLGVKLPSGEES